MFLFICVICSVGVNQFIDRHGRRRCWQVCEKFWGMSGRKCGGSYVMYWLPFRQRWR